MMQTFCGESKSMFTLIEDDPQENAFEGIENTQEKAGIYKAEVLIR